MAGIDHPALYDIARQLCHERGWPWTDPRTGVTYTPDDPSMITKREYRARAQIWRQFFAGILEAMTKHEQAARTLVFDIDDLTQLTELMDFVIDMTELPDSSRSRSI